MRLGRHIGHWSAGGLIAALLALPGGAWGQATVDDPDASATDLMTRIDGPGVTLSNPNIPSANASDSAQMYGLFSNGIAGANLGIDRGIVLTTGTVAEALTSNSSARISQGGSTTYADPDISAIDSSAIYNVAVFEVDVTLGDFTTGLAINYQFGSDEYPDFVGSQYNDIFGFFVSGPGITGTLNFAQAPLGGDVRINTINIGTVGCSDDGTPQDLTQSAYYQNNGHLTSLPTDCQRDATLPGPFPVVVEYNGISTVLTADRRTLTPGGTYRIKFAVADAADETFDTGVFIEMITGIYDQDHADAPASYGSPVHDISSTSLMGASRTSETAGYHDPNAAGDVDDGVKLPSFTQGQTSTLSVGVTGKGQLQAWFDWNGDGDFLDAGEQVATNVTDGSVDDQDGASNGTIQLAVTPPVDATLSQTFARFRWSADGNLAPDSGTASDGEVEDYALTIAEASAAICPAGYTLTPQTGHAGTVITAALNSENALGAPATEGTIASSSLSARIRNTLPTLVLEFDDLVPENATIDVLIARRNTGSNSDIDLSADGVNFTTITTENTGDIDVLRRVTLDVPAGGARFIRVQRNSGSTWVDGLTYTEICVAPPPQLSGSKDIAVFDPNETGDVYAVPGSDVIYTLTLTNEGTIATDADSVVLIDQMPGEVEFFNADIDTGGPDTWSGSDPVGWDAGSTGLTLAWPTDVAFSNAATRPTGFANCTYTPLPGYDPAVTYVCFNPKGAMAAGDPDPTATIAFRARIR